MKKKLVDRRAIKMKKIVLLSFCFSGMAALIYEVVWTRPLSLIFGSSIYAVSTMLTAFMAGLALGSYIMSKFADRIKNLLSAYALLELGIGLYGILLISIFNHLPQAYIALYKSFHSQFYLFSILQFLLCFSVLLIPTSLMGATFPLVVKFYSGERVGKGVGEVYSVNTVGALIGSFCTGFILIPLFGIKHTIIFAGAINLLIGSLILFLSSPRFAKKVIPPVVLFFIIVGPSQNYNIGRLTYGAFYYSHLPKKVMENSEVLFYKDGLYGTVTVLDQKDSGIKSLLINGKGNGSTSFTDSRTNFLLAYFPLLLHKSPKRSLNIGLGTGTTSGILSKYTTVETVEIDPAVVKASEQFKDVNNNVLNQPNHKLIIADARTYLSLSEEKYDIITSEPPGTWQATSTNLFSKEFYEIIQSRLKKNGLYAQWVPIYELMAEDFRSFYRTFSSVFPHIVAFGNIREETLGGQWITTSELILIGSPDQIELSEEKIAEKTKNVQIYKDLYYVRIDDIHQLMNLFYFTGDKMRGYGEGAPLVTDNNLILEFSSAKTIILKRDPTRVIKDIEDFLEKGI